MQFKNNNLHLLTFSILLSIETPVFAVSNNIDQIICIESDTQLLDVKKNLATFSGNVTITQGTIKINADKVIVTHTNDEHGKEIIDGYGHPIAFYQMQENGKLIKGHALQIHYELARNYIILTGNAYLEQPDSNITSDKISYSIKEKKMRAFSARGKRVTTILMLSQLKNKNDKQIRTQKQMTNFHDNINYKKSR